MVRKENSRPGSALTTSHARDQRIHLAALRPRNLAPVTAASEPPSHRARWHSGLNSPILVTSATRPYTVAASASMWIVTSPLVLIIHPVTFESTVRVVITR